MTKADMLAKAEDEFEALDRLVKKLEPQQWELPVPRPESRDPWSVKDALAHIVHWKHLTSRRLRGLGRPADERRLTITEINRRVYEGWRRRPPQDVLAWHNQVHEEVIAALGSRPDEWFTARQRGADWLGDLHSHSATHRRRDIEPALSAHTKASQGSAERSQASVATPAEEQPNLIVSDADAWRRWLGTHHAGSPGVWLVLAKKGWLTPTKLTYDAALEEALAHGWIDGQAKARDAATYRQRFTPRRRRSSWSKRNTVIAERLLSEGRMHAAGITEIERAKADGRWAAAYHSSASIEVPDDLTAALNTEPAAKAMFAILSGPNRYAVLYRIQAARRPETRARRIEHFVAMLARGETVYPQRKTLPGR